MVFFFEVFRPLIKVFFLKGGNLIKYIRKALVEIHVHEFLNDVCDPNSFVGFKLDVDFINQTIPVKIDRTLN